MEYTEIVKIPSLPKMVMKVFFFEIIEKYKEDAVCEKRCKINQKTRKICSKCVKKIKI